MHCLLDLPVPLRPTRAYLCPSLRRSLALERISMPSTLPLDLPLAAALDAALEEPAVPAAGGGAMVILSPSMSSCDTR